MRLAMTWCAVALLALAGCRGELQSDLNVSTVQRAALGQAYQVPATISVEVGTTANCQTYQIPVMVALDKGFGDSRFLACRKAGGTVFADYRIELLVTGAGHGKRPLFLQVTSGKGETVVSLQRDNAQVAEMASVLPRGLRRVLEQQAQVSVQVRLHNDSSRAMTVSVPAAVVNGRPQTQASAVRLERGGSVAVAPAAFSGIAPRQTTTALFWWPAG